MKKNDQTPPESKRKKAPAEKNAATKKPPQESRCLVAGIGASAGALESYKKFLSEMPLESGISFVLVQHLDPRHKTLMPELLAASTSMPIILVTEETRVEPNHVYLIPADTVLTISKGVLHPSAPLSGQMERNTIDHFFRSLAHDQEECGVGIILSGNGSDGTEGVKAIKERGGMTMTQNVELARYPGMPRSAIESGLIDHILPIAEMPARLIEYAKYINEIRHTKRNGGIHNEAADQLARICSILRRQTGHDFSQYKRSTLVRRIQHRIQVQHAESVTGYVDRLLNDPREVDQLFKDLLIGVTHFFRDTEAFESLAANVIPRIFEEKDGNGYVRVWVPGCSSGEEAYTIAILLSEYIAEHDPSLNAQIFATDIDDEALEIARQARYPVAIEEHVPQERLQRYFIRHPEGYQINKDIREMCIFSTHNLIKDPPFSRLDLISCRNMLIYLESDIQKQIVPLFHYSLRPGGYLFLGPSESIAGHPELFRTVDKKHRIFQSKSAVIRPAINFPMVEQRRLTRHTHDATHRMISGKEQNVGTVLERILLESYAPASVIVNEQNDVVYFFGRTGRFLEQPAGTPSLNVINMARKGLKLDLRTALHKSVKRREEVVHENVAVATDHGVQRINLIIRPMTELGEDSGLFMILFQEIGASKSLEEAVAEGSAPRSDDTLIQQLEHELRTTKEYLQATIEELEASNEELTSSNEELLSMNEEIQSANEELQTSKEELQSVNEELETINTELNKKVDELDRANSDLQNLFQSTQIATIFLDSDLCIKKFTPAATDVFRLIDGDIGRPIIDIAPRFADTLLLDDIRDVLRTLATRERLVHLVEMHAWYIMRVLPYRTVDNVIDGVVINFVDVTELKEAEERIMQLNLDLDDRISELEILFEVLPVGVAISNDPDSTMMRLNPVGAQILGLEPARGSLETPVDSVNRPYRIYHQGNPIAMENEPLQRAIRSGEAVRHFEVDVVRGDDTVVHLVVNSSPLLDKDGDIRGAIATFADITAVKQAQMLVEQRAAQQAALADLGIYALQEPTLEQIFNRAVKLLHDTLGIEFIEILELLPDGALLVLKGGRGWKQHYIGEATLGTGFDSQAGYTLASEEPVIVEDLGRETRFRPSWLLLEHGIVSGMSVIIYGENAPYGALGVHSAMKRRFTEDDISFLQAVANVLGSAIQRQSHLYALAEEEHRFRAMAETVPGFLFTNTPDGGYDYASAQFYEYTGLRPGEAEGEGWMRAIHPDDIERVRMQWFDSIGQGRSFETEYRIRSDAGEYRWFVVRSNPIHDSEGRVVKWFGASTDIHERKVAEEQIQESRQELLDFVENATIGLHWVNAEGNIIWANRAELELLGYSREEYVGHSIAEFHVDGPTIEDIRHRLANKEVLNNYEARLRCKDGSIKYVLISSNVLWKDGNFIHTRCFTRDITERRMAEEALRQNEEQLRAIFNQVTVGIVQCDRSGRIVVVNERFCEILGRTREDLLSMTITDLTHPDDMAETARLFTKLVNEEHAFVTEKRYIRPDGSIVWTNCSATILHDADGAPLHTVAVILDVTDNKRAEEALRRSEEQFRRAIIDAPIPIIMHAEDGEILQVSTTLTRLTGYALEDIPTFDDWLRLTYGENRDEAARNVQQLFEMRDGTREEEMIITTRNGEQRVWSVTASAPGRLLDGRRFLVGMATDITDRRRADEERARLLARAQEAREQAEEARERSSFVAEASTILAASLDYEITFSSLTRLTVPRIADYCVIYEVEDEEDFHLKAYAHADPEKEPLLQILERIYTFAAKAPGSTIATAIRECTPQLTAGGVLERARQVVRDEELLNALEQLGPESMMVLPLVVRGRAIGMMILVMSDSGRLYEEQDMELGMELARRAAISIDNAHLYHDAQQANAAKDQFLAVLSHELRTPLTPALASVEALQEQPLQEEARTFVDLIRRNIELEARLIDDLLDLTRIIKGKLRLDSDLTDVHALTRNVLDICRGEIGAKRLLLAVDLQADQYIVRGDSARLQQVFWNIIKNAIKFTPDGGSVAIISRNDGNDIIIEVSDTGVGIEESMLPVIFNAFEQGEQSITRRFGGLGLGLAISKSLVEMHGGSVMATSDGRDFGATFTIRLPLAPRENGTPPNGNGSLPKRALRVLVVDDHRDTAGVVRLLLDRKGIQVYTAYNMESAIDLASRQEFDLLISDLTLPEGASGTELIAKLGGTRDLKAIAVSDTAIGPMTDMSGFAVHLVKPFSARVLHEAIDRVLGDFRF